MKTQTHLILIGYRAIGLPPSQHLSPKGKVETDQKSSSTAGSRDDLLGRGLTLTSFRAGGNLPFCKEAFTTGWNQLLVSSHEMLTNLEDVSGTLIINVY